MSIIRQLSELIGRAQLAAAAGLTFEGARDLYKVLGFKRTLTPKDYRERYERNSVAGRVVDTYPKSTWRGFVELIEDEDPQVLTPFEEAWVEFATRLKVNSVFKRADILAGLGEYSVVVIGAPGNSLEEELPNNLKLEDIVYLQPYSQSDAPIHSYISDDKDDRYGLPEFYTIKRIADGPLLAGNSRPSMKDVRCHWTRVIHFSDGLLDDNVLGIPRLKRVWNDLDNLEKVTGGGAEAFWMKANGGVVFDVDKDIKLDKQGKEDLTKELDEYQHGQRRFLRTRGVTTQDLGSEAVDFSPQVASLLSLVSAGSEIPQRLLLGSERGELASTQDRENWKERVQDRRDEYAGPSVLHVFVDRMIEHGPLPKPDEGYDVRWAEVYDVSKTEQAELADKWAGLNSKAGETVVTGDEIRDRILGLPPLEEVLDPEELALREPRDLEVEQVEVGEEEDEEESQPRAAQQLKSTLLLFIARRTPTSDATVKRSWARPVARVARSASERWSGRSTVETGKLSSRRSTRQVS